MKIDVIIPNYNGANLIKRNLPLVINAISEYKNARIIIVDDGSKKEDVDALTEFIDNFKDKDRILFKAYEVNKGFSSNMDRGIDLSDGDLLVFLNSDVIPEKNFLKPILARFEQDKDLFGVGCMDKSIEGKEVILRGRGEASWDRGFLLHRKGELNRDDTFWVSGGSSVIRSSFLKKLKGFDPLYNPFYWEDIDLSYRAVKSGYKIAFESRSVVEHYHEEGAIRRHFTSYRVKEISYRNQFIFVWKNITDVSLIASHLFWLPYHFITALMRLDKAFFMGFLLALLKLPDIIKHRRSSAKLFVLNDREIIK